jgi:hypothetical protein
VFSDKKGKQAKASTLEPSFFAQLNWARLRYPDLFPPNVNIEDDYAGIPRSSRRGSSTEAVNQGVPSNIIEMMCRWRKVERAQGRAPKLGMRASTIWRFHRRWKLLYSTPGRSKSSTLARSATDGPWRFCVLCSKLKRNRRTGGKLPVGFVIGGHKSGESTR